MRTFGKTLLIALVSLAAMPAIAYAQATIAGVVKDTSGAVLPGVTVEASSPALIEKSRVGVTDGTGQFRIENLRPGAYTVTYTLAGFNTVKREGIELVGTFTATVNAEMRVGALEETITVVGETPIVDVQGTTRQSVIEHAVVDAIPAGRGPTGFYSYGLLLPGVVPGNNALQDVGGSSGTYMVRLSAHGGDGGDQLITQNGVGVGSLNDQGWFNKSWSTWPPQRNLRSIPGRSVRSTRAAACTSTSCPRTAATRTKARSSRRSRTRACSRPTSRRR